MAQARPCLAGIKWTFLVFEDLEANAMVLPCGTVLVYTGLLDLMAGSYIRPLSGSTQALLRGNWLIPLHSQNGSG